MEADYAADIAFFGNTPSQAESLQYSLEQATGGIGLYVNANKTEYVCFKQEGAISTLYRGSLKSVDKLTYLGSSVSSIEIDVNMCLARAWTVLVRLPVIWRSDLFNKIK